VWNRQKRCEWGSMSCPVERAPAGRSTCEDFGRQVEEQEASTRNTSSIRRLWLVNTRLQDREAAVRCDPPLRGRLAIHTGRPRHVPPTTALAEEESLEPTIRPSSLRGTADVHFTIYVAALRTALADPRQPSAAESWLLVSTARPQLGLSSDRVRQELSPEPCRSRNANLGRTTSQQHGEFHRPAADADARIRFPQRAASTLCGKPGVAAGGLSGIASPVAFQHPIPNHFGIEARKRAARVVREGVRAILRGQQPVEDLHPCGGADPRIEQSAQRLVQQAPVEPDEVIVSPRVAFARCFCSLGADRSRLSWPRAIGPG
jgi:hypothetical protein